MNDHAVCIELSDISFKWPDASENLLSIDQLKINKGESIFIQGASGSGKSTLLNILTGVLSPATGKLTILDQDLARLTHSQCDKFRANHFGIIFQQFNLIPYLSVLENVTLPLSFSEHKFLKVQALDDDINKQALELLHALDLHDNNLAHQNVTQLSTGQQQRVAAARALIGTPEIIIADEPTSALDADAKYRFIELLFKETQKARSTLVFVSHDPSLSTMFDRTLSISELNA